MSKGRADRRKKLLQAIVASIAVIGAIFGLVVWPQWTALREARQKLAELELEAGGNSAEAVLAAHSEMMTVSNELSRIEATMADGNDAYLWMVKVLDGFQSTHGIKFNDIEAPEITENVALPSVPYKMASFSISGRATYHRFGIFLADFENAFPFARLKELELQAAGRSRGESQESEELRFKMGVTILVTTNLPPVRQRPVH